MALLDESRIEKVSIKRVKIHNKKDLEIEFKIGRKYYFPFEYIRRVFGIELNKRDYIRRTRIENGWVLNIYFSKDMKNIGEPQKKRYEMMYDHIWHLAEPDAGNYKYRILWALKGDKVFHRESCPKLLKVYNLDESGYEWFNDEKKPLRMGKVPCKLCHPEMKFADYYKNIVVKNIKQYKKAMNVNYVIDRYIKINGKYELKYD